MSLIVAAWQSPTDYALAADTRVSGGGGSMHGLMSKSFRLRQWFVGMTGGVPAAYRYRRHLEAYVADPESAPIQTRHDLEEVLLAAFDLVLPESGTVEPGEYPRTGAALLLVGPPGICLFEVSGFAQWFEVPSGDTIATAASGCAEEYAVGWLDALGVGARRGDDLGGLCKSAVMAASARFDGVGGPIEVYRSGDLPEYGPPPEKRPKRARAEVPKPSHRPAPVKAPEPAPMVQAAETRALRQKTGASLLDCQRALTEARGDQEYAANWLRSKMRMA